MRVYVFPFPVLCLFALAPCSVNAQAPEAIRYQAVARDSVGELVVNTAVGVQFQVHSGSAGGPVVYAETHNPTTNTQGLFTVAVGEGTPSTGTFSSIDWAAATYWVEVGLDPAGGTAYGTIGVQQLLSVPYALEAKSAAHASSATLADTATTAVHADTASYALNAGPAGTAVGEMRYWNGTDWVAVAPGSNAQTLTFCNGAPRWGHCPVQDRLNSGETPCEIVNDGVPIDSLWGKSYLGGLIAYLDPNTCQGFVATATDVSVQIGWSVLTGPCGNILVGTTSTDLFTGDANSAAMEGTGCITIVWHLTWDFGTDWSVPSRDELAMLYTNLHLKGLGGFVSTAGTAYWSSSEFDVGHAWITSFNDGVATTDYKGNSHSIRGVKFF